MFVLMIDLFCAALLTAALFILCVHNPVMTDLRNLFSDRSVGVIVQFEWRYTVALFFFVAFKFPSYLHNLLVMSNREHCEMYREISMDIIKKTTDENVT